MANRKFENSDRGKRPFSPKRENSRSEGLGRYEGRPKKDWKSKADETGNRKSFISKFKRKSDSTPGEKKSVTSSEKEPYHRLRLVR